jgi:hypothetical protein
MITIFLAERWAKERFSGESAGGMIDIGVTDCEYAPNSDPTTHAG